MIKHCYRVFIFMFSIIFSLRAQIVESTNICDVLKYIDSCDQKVLVVFDIDNTLACPKNILGSDQWFSYLFHKKSCEGCSLQAILDAVLPIYYAVHYVVSFVPVEPCAPMLVKQLQSNNIKVMALTGRSWPLADRTIEQLAALPIDFSINSLCPYELDFGPVFLSGYKKGIIFASDNNKGKLLLSFLDIVNFHPDKVVFIDDKLKNVTVVENQLVASGVSCVGIRYGYQDVAVAQFDPMCAQAQLEDFFKLVGLDDEKERETTLNNFYTCLVHKNAGALSCTAFLMRLVMAREDYSVAHEIFRSNLWHYSSHNTSGNGFYVVPVPRQS